MIFPPNFCLFQDLSNGRVKEICREGDGLYILTGNTKIHHQNKYCVIAVKNDNNYGKSEDVDLWHKRLGHAFTRALDKLIYLKSDCIENTVNKCIVCPYARQVRNSFPTSSIQTPGCFKLIHVDFWGP